MGYGTGGFALSGGVGFGVVFSLSASVEAPLPPLPFAFACGANFLGDVDLSDMGTYGVGVTIYSKELFSIGFGASQDNSKVVLLAALPELGQAGGLAHYREMRANLMALPSP